MRSMFSEWRTNKLKLFASKKWDYCTAFVWELWSLDDGVDKCWISNAVDKHAAELHGFNCRGRWYLRYTTRVSCLSDSTGHFSPSAYIFWHAKLASLLAGTDCIQQPDLLCQHVSQNDFEMYARRHNCNGEATRAPGRVYRPSRYSSGTA
jgi:hypothetical protein